MNQSLLSVVTTTFNSGKHIICFLEEMQHVLRLLPWRWELIIVDDGSRDDSVTKCLSMASKNPGISVIELSRNFGKEPALLEGLARARGDLVLITDSDLEDPPATLFTMLDVMNNSDVQIDVVYGVSPVRHGSLQHRIGGNLFAWVFNLLSDVRVPVGVLPIRLMTRRYVSAVLRHGERIPILIPLFVSVGFEQRPVTVERTYKGYSSFTFWLRLHLALRYLILCSSKLPTIIALAGILTCFLALPITVMSLIGCLWANGYCLYIVAAVSLLLGGLAITGIGICAVYGWYILQEVKRSPRVIVKAIYEGKGDAHDVSDKAGFS